MMVVKSSNSLNLNTFVISDLHLSDAEPLHEGNALWKKFRQQEYFIDGEFEKFIKTIMAKANGPIELVLNGDIFDFDSVMSLPPNRKTFKYNKYEKKRGLGSEERKSVFKVQSILQDHHLWIEALSSFVKKGHKVIFVIGNHDIELHWPKVQQEIIKRMELAEHFKEQIVFLKSLKTLF